MFITLPDAVLHAIQMLNRAGHEAFAVGGSLRDLLLGKEPHDWDVTTSALPEDIASLFLEKTPKGIDIEEIKEHLEKIDGVCEVHHIHIWSMDMINHYATLHAVISADAYEAKEMVKKELFEHGISHVTVETETKGETCRDRECSIRCETGVHSHHHAHH